MRPVTTIVLLVLILLIVVASFVWFSPFLFGS
jgi:dolichyl-phosphate-mannose--protein O-mannosyl transferase